MRYLDNNGDIHKVDSCRNHFINGKCVNPKSWEAAQIGDTFDEIDPETLKEFPVSDEIVVTGHVSEFEYHDHDLKKIVKVNTGNYEK